MHDGARTQLQPPPDLVFIDGMHLFELALRDLINVEHLAAPSTLVAIDDIDPCHPAQAERHRRTDAWTGDLWKLHQILRTCRPKLTLLALNAHTTGLLLIAGLDPQDRVLEASDAAAVRRHLHSGPPPPAVLTRQGAIPSDHALVADLVAVLKQAKAEAWSVAQVRTALAALTLQGDARRLATEPELIIASEGTDPIILLPRLERLAPGAQPGWLEVRMRIEPEANAEGEESQSGAV